MRAPPDPDAAPATRQGSDRRTVPAERADSDRIERMHLRPASHLSGSSACHIDSEEPREHPDRHRQGHFCPPRGRLERRRVVRRRVDLRTRRLRVRRQRPLPQRPAAGWRSFVRGAARPRGGGERSECQRRVSSSRRARARLWPGRSPRFWRCGPESRFGQRPPRASYASRRRSRTSPATRSTTASGSSCSHARRTVQPPDVKTASCLASRARFSSILFDQ